MGGTSKLTNGLVVNGSVAYTNTKQQNPKSGASFFGDYGGGTGGSTTKGNNPSKWADVVGGPKRGVANNPTQAAQIWAKDVGGPTRGVANKLGTA